MNPEAYQEMERICPDALDTSVSAKLDELVKKWLQELAGEKSEEVATVEYEVLKRCHFKMVKELDRLENHLEKKKVFDKLTRLVHTLEMDTQTLSNLSEVAPKLLDEWIRQGCSKEDAEICLHDLELVREKSQVELWLDELRRLENVF